MRAIVRYNFVDVKQEMVVCAVALLRAMLAQPVSKKSKHRC